MAEDQKKNKNKDLFVKLPSDEYIRLREGEGVVETGELVKVKSGAPINGELLRLTSTDHPLLYEGETVIDTRETQGGSKGPAQVATPAYRSNYERIFGSTPKEELN